jgi:hypothetical protein
VVEVADGRDWLGSGLTARSTPDIEVCHHNRGH